LWEKVIGYVKYVKRHTTDKENIVVQQNVPTFIRQEKFLIYQKMKENDDQILCH